MMVFRRVFGEEEDHDQQKTSFGTEIPPGMKLLHTLEQHAAWVGRIAWSPNGRVLALPSTNKTICLWNPNTNQIIRTLEGHTERVVSVGWSPDGQMLASGSEDRTIQLWDPTTGRILRILQGQHERSINCVAWSPDGQILASGSDDHTIRLWDPISGEIRRTLRGRAGQIFSIAWSPDGQTLASGSDDATIQLWEPTTGQFIRILEGHTDTVYSIAWSSDSQTLVSGSHDQTIRLWNPRTEKLLHTLEGHTRSIWHVFFSPDGRLLASKAADGVSLWRCDTWERVATLNETGVDVWLSGGAFHPYEANLLATVGNGKNGKDTAIHFWDLDLDYLLGQAPSGDSIKYTNARVVLVGDTGVGKSGLALTLMDQPWVPTDSTHSRKIYTLEDKIVDLPDGRREQRETLLWDLAGQPGYRIIHQMQLTEVSVALLCFDARADNNDLFVGVKYWNRALQQAQQAQEGLGGVVPLVRKFLVSARGDRGGNVISPERIDEMVESLGFDGYFETSAKEGWGIDELRDAIINAIDWDDLPRASSTEIFVGIKDFLTEKKEAGLLISSEEALYNAYMDSVYAPAASRQVHAEFATVIGRLESRGLIRRLTFGKLILLQPELLDAYASLMVFAAREDPDGLGFLPEADAREGKFPMARDARLADRATEELLLIATIENLLRYEIAFRDEGNLIFPTQFRLERADYLNPEGQSAVIRFEGAVQNIYTRLVVRLARSGLFERSGMWRNAVTYRDIQSKGVCGIVLRQFDEGQGEFTIFYDSRVGTDTRRSFEGFVQVHLQRLAMPRSINLQQLLVCPNCQHDLTRAAQRRRELGQDTIRCPVCETEISLFAEDEPVLPEPVVYMNEAANRQRDREAAVYTLEGKIVTNDFDVFLCHNTEDKPAVRELAAQLKARGLYPWLDEEQIRPGLRWQDALQDQIENIKSAAVFVGASGIGPWQRMEIEAFLREFVDRQCPVIPVMLPNCPETPDLPIFMRGLQWVDFRNTDFDPLAQLTWGITGERRGF